MARPAPRKPARHPAKEIKAGSVVVRLSGNAAKGWWICRRDYPGGPRLRTYRRHFAKAKALAEDEANRLANADASARDFTAADRARLRHADDLLRPVDLRIETVAAEHAAAVALLRAAGDPRTPLEVVREALRARPAGVVPKPVPEIVQELLSRKEAEGRSTEYTRNLRHQLEHFAARFPGPLAAVQPESVDQYLRGLPVKPRTAKNYFAAILLLEQYAMRQNYRAKDRPIIAHVAPPVVPLTDIQIYTPDEARRLLHQAHGEAAATSKPGILPFLAIQLFAGVRHQEMSARHKAVVVRWEDVDLARGFIRISARAAKVKRQRLVSIGANLKAWLEPWAKAKGPICDSSDTAGALKALAGRAGVAWKKNAPRKSFISYRVARTNDIAATSREAGNSPGQIEASYQALATPDQAAEWFAILPPPGAQSAGEVIPVAFA